MSARLAGETVRVARCVGAVGREDTPGCQCGWLGASGADASGGERWGEPTWRECHRQAGPTWRVSHRQAGPVVFNCHEGWPLRIRVLPGPVCRRCWPGGHTPLAPPYGCSCPNQWVSGMAQSRDRDTTDQDARCAGADGRGGTPSSPVCRRCWPGGHTRLPSASALLAGMTHQAASGLQKEIRDGTGGACLGRFLP